MSGSRAGCGAALGATSAGCGGMSACCARAGTAHTAKLRIITAGKTSSETAVRIVVSSRPKSTPCRWPGANPAARQASLVPATGLLQAVDDRQILLGQLGLAGPPVGLGPI